MRVHGLYELVIGYWGAGGEIVGGLPFIPTSRTRTLDKFLRIKLLFSHKLLES